MKKNMKKRVFIIHGWDGNPNEAWLGWLRDELNRKDFEVISPQMPNADKPEINEWVAFLSELVGEPNEQDFFVGHSIGCQTIMRYLEKIYPKKIRGAIFVAGWFNLVNLENQASEEIAESWIKTPINFEKVKNVADNFTVFLSDTDEWVPLSDKELFEERIGAKVIVQENKGHFTEDDDAEQIPEILELI